MFDFKRADRPSGWITEQQGCSDWFNSTYRAVNVNLLENADERTFLRCRDLPQVGDTISEFGEYGEYDDFPYEVKRVDVDSETVTASDGDSSIEIPFSKLCCLNGSPMWSTVWELGYEPGYDEIWMLNDCGIGVYEDEDSDWYIGIDGCGYDFYEAHWLKLYRKQGLQWHSTEEGWLRELRFRVRSYCEMCADMPDWLAFAQRRDILEKAVEKALNQRRIERATRLALIPFRLKRLWSCLKSSLASFGKQMLSGITTVKEVVRHRCQGA